MDKILGKLVENIYFHTQIDNASDKKKATAGVKIHLRQYKDKGNIKKW